MTLNIGSSLTGGLRRIGNRNGLALILGYAILGVVWQVTFYSAFVALLRGPEMPTEDLGLPTVEAPFALMAVGALLSLLALQYLTVVAIRTFVGDHARSIPSNYYTRRIAFVLVNSIVGGVAFGLIVMIGSLFLFVPGIIAYVAFLFMPMYVAVEDENFVAALRDSWALTRGNWLSVFGLLVIMFVAITVVAGVISGVLQLGLAAAGNEALGTLVAGIVYLPFSLLTLAILAEAFTQLRSGQEVDAEL